MHRMRVPIETPPGPVETPRDTGTKKRRRRVCIARCFSSVAHDLRSELCALPRLSQPWPAGLWPAHVLRGCVAHCCSFLCLFVQKHRCFLMDLEVMHRLLGNLMAASTNPRVLISSILDHLTVLMGCVGLA